MSKLYLIKLGEISLKGLNRGFFEKKLKNNLKLKLRPYHSRFSQQKGRVFIEFDDEAPDELIRKVLTTTFGITGFSKALSCGKNLDEIMEIARKVISEGPFLEASGSFKVEARRADKSFSMNSYQIECELGGLVLDTYPQMRVDVHNPQKLLFCEIRDKAYVYSSPVAGPGGLPTGTAGKGLLLLSGGIDSPVAGYRMAKRGLKMDCLYFHAYPYTSEQALQKVKDLAMLISPYLQGTVLHVVNFTETELWIKDHSNEEEHTLMMRACMMKVANMIAKKRECSCLVTGEALSQVASQTLESLAYTDSTSDLLVLRPLVGMDKQEIVDLSVKIGTFETSILPYDDCCVIFSPKHPLVRPSISRENQSFLNMKIDDLIAKAAETAESFEFLVEDSCRFQDFTIRSLFNPF